MSCFNSCFGGGVGSPRDAKNPGARYEVRSQSVGDAGTQQAGDGGSDGQGGGATRPGGDAAAPAASFVRVASGSPLKGSHGLSALGEGGKGSDRVGGGLMASVGVIGADGVMQPLSTGPEQASSGFEAKNSEFKPMSTPKSIFHVQANGGDAAGQDGGGQGGAERPWRTQEQLVKDGDGKCALGVAVFLSEQWMQVPYFSQFKGLRGVLTRRGLGGVTWYATFPGMHEQAFSTGMHGQHVLVYATESSSTDAAPAAPKQQQQREEEEHAPPPKPRNILPPLAAVGAVAPPRKEFVTQQPFAAKPVDVHGAGSARRDRPSTARSRQIMGAPPLGSGRSQLSARGIKNLGLQVGATPRDGSMTGRDNKRGRLFKYPEWEEYELFDSDDLWSEHCYLLYGEAAPGGNVAAPGGNVAAPGGNVVYVWIGQYMEEVDSSSDKVCDAFARKAVSDFKVIKGGWPVGQIIFVRELKEPENFWDYFCWG